MLVLSRKAQEEIMIGDDIRITVVEVAPGRVKLGITAPRSVRVDRGEIHTRKQQEDAESTPDSFELELSQDRIVPKNRLLNLVAQRQRKPR
jgi:carbon storage regulator